MKKQGPPEPLSEEHYTNLKRKKGLPVDDAPAEVPTNKKRRTASKQEPAPKSNGKAAAKVAASSRAAKTANGSKTSLNGSKESKKNVISKAKKTPVPALDSESGDELDDEFGASDLEDGSGSGLDGDELGDDFLGSDGSVYESDEEGPKKKFVFSDDEDDESDAEEKLTAANIEGLSKKLDKQLEEEAAENEAELRGDALQTNIDGDRPHVLGDGEDEEDELASKTKSLLAPDIQMLRARMTDTIRVLEDFSKLAEEGRSRAEYTAQLLKDVCDCTSSHHTAHLLKTAANQGTTDYGYSEFLAEKLMCVLGYLGLPPFAHVTMF